MSIANQKQMLMDYVKEKGWNLREVYVDDGFSGTNFDRPDFKRLIKDISKGLIDCVITKDLSRLGRNYSKVGYYTEEFFIEQGVRFIAINDSFDTMREEENEIAPFKSLRLAKVNSWAARRLLATKSHPKTVMFLFLMTLPPILSARCSMSSPLVTVPE
jgi:DNA invertase Pin-like site-specific DNA recombinase